MKLPNQFAFIADGGMGTRKPLPPQTQRAPGSLAGRREPFDAIICFGGVDWWYHNRGHYDLQLMRELSAVTPVLYINSIGMRVPSIRERGRTFQRYIRKLQSIRRGMVEVRPGMTVYSPITLPARFGRGLLKKFLSFQIRRAARALKIRRPLVWIACPPALEILEDLAPHGVVYQRTDRYEDYPGVNVERIRDLDRALKARADLTLFSSSLSFEEERHQCQEALFVDHGVDFSLFEAAGDRKVEPPELAGVPHPRAGYIGNLEAHRVDQSLLAQAAQALPNVTFVVVGPGQLSGALAALRNVVHFGQQPYEKVGQFMAACDVLLLPVPKAGPQNEWIRGCNPVKLKEYLAVGRPVVATPLEELNRYQGVVNIAGDAEAFAATIRRVINAAQDAKVLRARVRNETWGAKSSLVLENLLHKGFHPAAPAETAGRV